MLPRGSRVICMIQHTFLGLDLYYTDPAQYLITADRDLDDLDRDLSDISDLSEVCKPSRKSVRQYEYRRAAPVFSRIRRCIPHPPGAVSKLACSNNQEGATAERYELGQPYKGLNVGLARPPSVSRI